MLTVVSIRASITFAAGQSSEIGRYEVPREESLPGLGIGMTIDDFQIAGIRHDVMESLKKSVSVLDFNFERAVGGSILMAGKKLSLKILNVTIRAIN